MVSVCPSDRVSLSIIPTAEALWVCVMGKVHPIWARGRGRTQPRENRKIQKESGEAQLKQAKTQATDFLLRLAELGKELS